MLDESLFAGESLHQRDVEVTPGKTISVHVRELPAVTFIKFHNINQSGTEDAKAGAAARLIAEGICDSDGKRSMTLEKALMLKPGPMRALFGVVMEVNAAAGGDDAGKP